MSEQKRAVVVVDRGWIFCGDVTEIDGMYIRLDNAIHVFRWSEIGFAKMLTEWKDKRVDLRPCPSVEIPAASIIFRVPVDGAWGIR